MFRHCRWSTKWLTKRSTGLRVRPRFASSGQPDAEQGTVTDYEAFKGYRASLVTRKRRKRKEFRHCRCAEPIGQTGVRPNFSMSSVEDDDVLRDALYLNAVEDLRAEDGPCSRENESLGRRCRADAGVADRSAIYAILLLYDQNSLRYLECLALYVSDFLTLPFVELLQNYYSYNYRVIIE